MIGPSQSKTPFAQQLREKVAANSSQRCWNSAGRSGRAMRCRPWCSKRYYETLSYCSESKVYHPLISTVGQAFSFVSPTLGSRPPSSQESPSPTGLGLHAETKARTTTITEILRTQFNTFATDSIDSHSLAVSLCHSASRCRCMSRRTISTHIVPSSQTYHNS